MSNNEQFIGSFTSFLTNAFDQIFNLMNRRDNIGASITLYNLIPFLDPNIKEKKEIKEYQEMHRGILLQASMVGGMNRGHVSRNRLETMNQKAYIILQGYLPIIANALHSAGYWSIEKYWGITPASLLGKKRETPEERPFPERLPEDLK